MAAIQIYQGKYPFQVKYHQNGNWRTQEFPDAQGAIDYIMTLNWEKGNKVCTDSVNPIHQILNNRNNNK